MKSSDIPAELVFRYAAEHERQDLIADPALRAVAGHPAHRLLRDGVPAKLAAHKIARLVSQGVLDEDYDGHPAAPECWPERYREAFAAIIAELGPAPTYEQQRALWEERDKRQQAYVAECRKRLVNGAGSVLDFVTVRTSDVQSSFMEHMNDYFMFGDGHRGKP